MTEHDHEIFKWVASIIMAVVILGGFAAIVIASRKIDRENKKKAS